MFVEFFEFFRIEDIPIIIIRRQLIISVDTTGLYRTVASDRRTPSVHPRPATGRRDGRTRRTEHFVEFFVAFSPSDSIRSVAHRRHARH
jgi:hypothetical protein